MELGDAFDKVNDVVTNEQFNLAATITSTLCPMRNNKKLGTYASTTIRVTRTKASQLATRANPLITDANGDLGFTNRVSNSAQNSKENVLTINQLPVNNNYGSRYHGSLSLKSLSLEGTGVSLDNGNVTVRGTTLSKYQSIDPSEITRTMVESDDFTTLTVNGDGMVTCPDGFDMGKVTGSIVEVGSMPSGSHLDTDIILSTANNRPEDLYVNRYTDMDNTVTAMATVANRIVSGVVFLDTDRDGARSSDDYLFPKVRVKVGKTGVHSR